MAFLKPTRMAAPAATPKATSKPSRAVDLVEGWAEFCAVEACAKALKGLGELRKSMVTAAVRARLVERGVKREGKPDTMSLAEGEASGSAYIRRKDSRAPLDRDTLELMAEQLAVDPERDEDGNITAIPGFTETVESQPALIAINPAHASNELLLRRLDEATKNIPGFPEDFVIEIPAQRKIVVADTAIDQLFRHKPEVVDALLPELSSIVLKPVFKDLTEAWRIVQPLLSEVPVEDEPERKRA